MMLCLAVGLGVWQIERLHWKEDLLSEIDRAERSPAVTLPSAPQPFEKVEVTGHLRDDLVARYGSEVRSTGAGPVLGSQVVVPLERASGVPILVDRGWLPDAVTAPKQAGEVTIVGYVRPPEPASRFAPGADLAAKRFWALDPAPIGAALGLPTVAPFTLVVLGSDPAASPAPATALPRPPNDHLGYAITWFSLAACLLAVFAAYARRTLRA